MHQASGGFYFILKKHLKLSQKIDFTIDFATLIQKGPSHRCFPVNLLKFLGIPIL